MGRPRTFDVDKAVHAATMLFWDKGYDRTSLADLTQELGITPPSFYFAFESKDGLFRKVTKHYLEKYLPFMDLALQKATAREVAETILYGCADVYTDAGHPTGCLIVNSSTPCINSAPEIQLELEQGRKARLAKIRKRLQEAKNLGDLPSESNPEELARYLMTLRWGMAIEARSGATRKDLRGIVNRALLAWPR
jgi:AcrR family transcriptional regulator